MGGSLGAFLEPMASDHNQLRLGSDWSLRWRKRPHLARGCSRAHSGFRKSEKESLVGGGPLKIKADKDVG